MGCGDTVDPWKGFEYLKDYLKAQKFNCMELRRGSKALINNPTQSMMPMRFDPDMYNNTLNNLRHSFTNEKTWIYLLPVDAYAGQQSFGLGFKDGVHPKHIDKDRVKTFCKDNKLRYYNYNIHFS